MARPIKYPWKKWFSKKKLKLTKGKDFDCRLDVMGIQLRNNAIKHDKHLKIKICDVTNTLTVEVNERNKNVPKYPRH